MALSQALEDGIDRVAAIQGLHDDLLALSESRLPTIERLCAELDTHIEAFRELLDHKPNSEESRKKLSTGKLDALVICRN